MKVVCGQGRPPAPVRAAFGITSRREFTKSLSSLMPSFSFGERIHSLLVVSLGRDGDDIL